MLHAGVGMDSETTHVCFINNRLRPGIPGWSVLMPMEVLMSEHAFRHGSGIIDFRTNQVSFRRRGIVSTRRAEVPIRQLRDRCRKWVQEQLVEVETMTVPGLIRAVHAIGIQLARLNPLDPDVPHVTSAVARRIQINHPGGYGIMRMIEQLQPNAAGVPAEECKVHSFATCIGSQRQWDPNSNISPLRYLCYISMQRAFERSRICARVLLFCGLV